MEFRTVTRTSRDSKEFRVQNLARGRAFARVCVARFSCVVCWGMLSTMLRDHHQGGLQGGLAFRRFSCVVCWGMLSTMLREDDHHHHQGGRFSCVVCWGMLSTMLREESRHQTHKHQTHKHQTHKHQTHKHTRRRKSGVQFRRRGFGRRMHLGVEVTESSTNKQHHLSRKA